jgi:hypothetical protein
MSMSTSGSAVHQLVDTALLDVHDAIVVDSRNRVPDPSIVGLLNGVPWTMSSSGSILQGLFS